MLAVSNALLMSSATVIVRSGGLFWLKHVAWRCVGCCLLCTGVVSSPVFLLSLREVRWVCMMYLCSYLCLVLELE